MVNEGHKENYFSPWELLLKTFSWLDVPIGLLISEAPFGVSSKTSFWVTVLALAIWLSYFGNDFSSLQGRALLERAHSKPLPLGSAIRRLFHLEDGNLLQNDDFGVLPLIRLRTR